MNRKDRLKITSTPDRKVNTRNIYQSSPQQPNVNYDYNQDISVNQDSSVNQDAYNDPMDDYYGESVDDSLFTPPDSYLRVCYRYFKNSLYYLKFVVPYGIVLYFIIQNFYGPSPTSDSDISELTREIDLLKQESIKMSLSAVEKPFNLCKIEHCTTVLLDKDDLYKYGLIGLRKSIDPYIIFGENAAPGDCLAFLPGEREFTLKFSKEVKIDNFHIFHPETGNRESAVKDFRLKGFYKDEEFEIGSFRYDISKENCQTFAFSEVVTDRLIFKILSNNGHKAYTTIYKIYALGIFN